MVGSTTMFGLTYPESMRPALRVTVEPGALRVILRGPPTRCRHYVGRSKGTIGRPRPRVVAQLLAMPGGAILAEAPLVSDDSSGEEGENGEGQALLSIPPDDPEWVGVRIHDGDPVTSDVFPYIVPLGQIRAGGIVDAHAHVGRLTPSDYPLDVLADLLTEGHVRHAFVSNLDGSERPQLESSSRLLAMAARDTRIVPVFWGNPDEGLTRPARALLDDGQFAGIKLHPMIHGFRADDDRLKEYFDVAAERGMFVLVHTEMQDPARPILLRRWLESHPGVTIVCGHTGLRGAWQEAIEMCARYPNVRGDLAWFGRFDLLARAIDRGLLDRFVFGSDAPVDGEDAYQQYMPFLMSLGLDRKRLHALLAENARTLCPPGALNAPRPTGP